MNVYRCRRKAHNYSCAKKHQAWLLANSNGNEEANADDHQDDDHTNNYQDDDRANDDRANDDQDFMELDNTEDATSLSLESFSRLSLDINPLPTTAENMQTIIPSHPRLEPDIDHDPDPSSEACVLAGVNPRAGLHRNRDVGLMASPPGLDMQFTGGGADTMLLRTAGVDSTTDTAACVSILRRILTMVLYDTERAQGNMAHILREVILCMFKQDDITPGDEFSMMQDAAKKHGWPTDVASMRRLRDKLKAMIPNSTFKMIPSRDGDELDSSGKKKPSNIWCANLQQLVSLMAASGAGQDDSPLVASKSPGCLNAVYPDSAPRTVKSPAESPLFLEQKGSEWKAVAGWREGSSWRAFPALMQKKILEWKRACQDQEDAGEHIDNDLLELDGKEDHLWKFNYGSNKCSCLGGTSSTGIDSEEMVWGHTFVSNLTIAVFTDGYQSNNVNDNARSAHLAALAIASPGTDIFAWNKIYIFGVCSGKADKELIYHELCRQLTELNNFGYGHLLDSKVLGALLPVILLIIAMIIDGPERRLTQGSGGGHPKAKDEFAETIHGFNKREVSQMLAFYTHKFKLKDIMASDQFGSNGLQRVTSLLRRQHVQQVLSLFLRHQKQAGPVKALLQRLGLSKTVERRLVKWVQVVTKLICSEYAPDRTRAQATEHIAHLLDTDNLDLQQTIVRHVKEVLQSTRLPRLWASPHMRIMQLVQGDMHALAEGVHLNIQDLLERFRTKSLRINDWAAEIDNLYIKALKYLRTKGMPMSHRPGNRSLQGKAGLTGSHLKAQSKFLSFGAASLFASRCEEAINFDPETDPFHYLKSRGISGMDEDNKRLSKEAAAALASVHCDTAQIFGLPVESLIELLVAYDTFNIEVYAPNVTAESILRLEEAVSDLMMAIVCVDEHLLGRKITSCSTAAHVEEYVLFKQPKLLGLILLPRQASEMGSLKNLSDELSVSYGQEEITLEGDTDDAEFEAVTVAYTSGGMTLSASMKESTNAAHNGASKIDDRDYWSLGLAFAF